MTLWFPFFGQNSKLRVEDRALYERTEINCTGLDLFEAMKEVERLPKYAQFPALLILLKSRQLDQASGAGQ